MVVIAIIGLLASIVLVSLNSVRKKSRAVKRIADLKQIQTALEMYYDANITYPSSSLGYRSECVGWGGYAASNVIPGLVLIYLPAFSSDPSMNKTANTSCYLYISNGVNYKVLDYNIAEFSAADYLAQSSLMDPARDSGSNQCVVDGSNPWAWAVSSSGAACW